MKNHTITPKDNGLLPSFTNLRSGYNKLGFLQIIYFI